jgi:hypothetical protein
MHKPTARGIEFVDIRHNLVPEIYVKLVGTLEVVVWGLGTWWSKLLDVGKNFGLKVGK